MQRCFRRITTFELTSPADRRAYEDLVNDPRNTVLTEQDFFGLSHTEAGPCTTIQRVVGYRGPDPGREPATPVEDVYAAPIC